MLHNLFFPPSFLASTLDQQLKKYQYVFIPHLDQHHDNRLQEAASHVSFIASQVKPPSIDPVDSGLEMFESMESIEEYPLATHQLPVVIEAYSKTIGRW